MLNEAKYSAPFLSPLSLPLPRSLWWVLALLKEICFRPQANPWANAWENLKQTHLICGQTPGQTPGQTLGKPWANPSIFWANPYLIDFLNVGNKARGYLVGPTNLPFYKENLLFFGTSSPPPHTSTHPLPHPLPLPSFIPSPSHETLFYITSTFLEFYRSSPLRSTSTETRIL